MPKAISSRAHHFRGQQKARRQRVRHTSLASFSPDDVATLDAWWDFSDASTMFTDTTFTTPVANDADAIAAVTEKTASVNVTQTTAGDRPLYKTGIQNGLSVARFTGGASGDSLESSVADGANITDIHDAADTMTIFYVADNNANEDSMRMAGFHSGTGNGPWYIAGGAAGSETNGQFVIHGVVAYSPFTTRFPSSFHIGTIVYDSSDDVTWYTNGTGAVTVAGAAVGNAYADHRFMIGEAQGGNWWSGDLGELLIYSSNLSTADKNSIGDYLGNKWGITWTNIT